MVDFFEIIRKRSTPGILVFDFDNNLLYYNEEAFKILSDFKEKENSSFKIPENIYMLLNQVKEKLQIIKTVEEIKELGKYYSFRAFPVGKHHEKENPTHIMILVETLQLRKEIDFEKIRSEYELTRRETEVLKLIYEGLSNKEISDKLFISEYTVKDHIKKIMKKMNVTSRSKLVSKIRSNF